MIIQALQSAPLDEIQCRTVDEHGTAVASLPVLSARVESLPADVLALVAMGDLHAIDMDSDQMLSEVVAAELQGLADLGMAPAAAQTGAILAGDLFGDATLQQRAMSGEVGGVWDAFADGFAWVAGVPGEHDSFAAEPRRDNVHFLDVGHVQAYGLRLAGLGGIIGHANRSFRRSEPDFLASLKRLLHWRPDILVLHESPASPHDGNPGNLAISEQLGQVSWPLLVISGHVAWPQPLVQLNPHVQILNVHMRVVVLTA